MIGLRGVSMNMTESPIVKQGNPETDGYFQPTKGPVPMPPGYRVDDWQFIHALISVLDGIVEVPSR